MISIFSTKFRQRDRVSIQMHLGSEILSVTTEDAGFCEVDVVLTLMGDITAPLADREFLMLNVGDEVPDGAKFIGSATEDRGFGRSNHTQFFFVK